MSLNNSINYSHMVPAWANDSPSGAKDSVIQPSSDPIINPHNDENQIYTANYKVVMNNELNTGNEGNILYNGQSYESHQQSSIQNDPSMIFNNYYDGDNNLANTYNNNQSIRYQQVDNDSRSMVEDMKEQVFDMLKSTKEEFIGFIHYLKEKKRRTG